MCDDSVDSTSHNPLVFSDCPSVCLSTRILGILVIIDCVGAEPLYAINSDVASSF